MTSARHPVKNRHRTLIVLPLTALLIGFSSTLAARLGRETPEGPTIASRYTPAHKEVIGRTQLNEIVLVLLASESCGACGHDSLPNAIERAKLAVQANAQENDLSFAAIGIGVDRDPEIGATNLERFGLFDEIAAGRGWSGLGLLHYMWDRHPGQAGVPQVLVLRRTLVGFPDQISGLDSEVLLGRFVGLREIFEWERREFALPAL